MQLKNFNMIIYVKSLVVISLLDINTIKSNQDKKKTAMSFKGSKIQIYIYFVDELYFTITFVV